MNALQPDNPNRVRKGSPVRKSPCRVCVVLGGLLLWPVSLFLLLGASEAQAWRSKDPYVAPPEPPPRPVYKVHPDYAHYVEEGGVIIAAYRGPGGDVMIPSEIEGKPVIGIGKSAFVWQEGITGVSIPDSVTHLEEEALASPDPATISIGSGLIRIGDGALRDSSAIKVDEANPAFSSRDGVLFDKAQTTLIQFPRYKSGPYTIPDSVTAIGDHAFFNASGLTSLVIPASVTHVGEFAFAGCRSLTNVVIGSGVVSIGVSAFKECTALRSIVVDEGNPFFSSLGGVLFDKGQSMLIVYPEGRSGPYLIPDSVTHIDSYAFANHKGLTSVKAGRKVAHIWPGTFAGCPGLTAITVDEGNPTYSHIDGVLFNKAQTVLILYPEGRSGPYIVPDGTIRIGDHAFEGSRRLTRVTIAPSVTHIGSAAFRHCVRLRRVYFLGNAPAHGYNVFDSSPPIIRYPVGASGWDQNYAGRPIVGWDPEPVSSND